MAALAASPGAARADAEDAASVAEAASGGTLEVALGLLAAESATDHGQANEPLRTAAEAEGIDVPSGM